MSRLLVSNGIRQFYLNVVSFDSAVFEETNNAQVRNLQVHFPIKMVQPSIVLNLQFTTPLEFENFQNFIREHQHNAINNVEILTLLWPERGINNWTAVASKFQAGDKRFNVGPTAQLQLDLVDSLVSRRTDFAGFAMPWYSIVGLMGLFVSALNEPSLLPQQIYGSSGFTVTDRGVILGRPQVSNGALPNGNTAPPVIPVFDLPISPGVTAGSGAL